jgi:hypothetical protein
MVFCTIITANFISYALALRESLLAIHDHIKLFVLVTENGNDLKRKIEDEYPDITILFYDELCREGIGKAIYDKYYATYMDGFRWSMKPVLLNYLLRVKGIEKVVYSDCDIQFYENYSFLFDELDNSNVLLTPHWRSSKGEVDTFNFMQLYIFGLYNGGFIAVNSKAVEAMEWWARANLFICEIDACKGQYVDQTHLNLMPIYFDGVKSLKHKGCNVADWNIIECKRFLMNNKVFINNEVPVVFVHYTWSTILAILENRDPLLLPYLQTYFKRLKFYGNDLEAKVKSERDLAWTRKKENEISKKARKKKPFFTALKIMIKKKLDRIL